MVIKLLFVVNCLYTVEDFLFNISELNVRFCISWSYVILSLMLSVFILTIKKLQFITESTDQHDWLSRVWSSCMMICRFIGFYDEDSVRNAVSRLNGKKLRGCSLVVEVSFRTKTWKSPSKWLKTYILQLLPSLS